MKNEVNRAPWAKKKTFLFILALCAASSVWGEDKSITETYVNAGTGASTSRVSFKSSFDENFTVWQRGGRSKATDVVSIGGQDVKGFWLSRQTSSSCYIEWGETDKQYLGGVKSVSFAYKQFGSEANHTMILDIEVNGEQVDRISFPAGTSPYPTYTYSKDLNAKKLTKLTIRNSSTATEGTTVNGRFVVGPVTITPYLYCPSSAQNVQYKVNESATYINPDFIDNTEGEATWSCAPEGIVTVADGVVTPIEGKSGNVVITAKLNDIEVSYNLEVITSSEPEEEAYVETFERNSGGASDADRVGAYYTWTITTGARTKATDILFNKTPSIWLSGNGGASMETTIEGGVKRVGFLWNKFNKTANPISVSVIAGGVERTLTKEVQTGEAYNQNDPDLVFNSNFGIKSNTKLKIANPQTTTALQIGPIAITPYIFYTVKDTTIDRTKVATFTNDQLIDNRDDEVAIVYSIIGDNDGVATIDATTGVVTCLKAGTITVQAAYGEAKTTYALTINSKGEVDAHFATEGKVEKVLADGSFTNAVVVTAGDATPAYESDNTNVAEVDAEGKVTIKAIGTAMITATMAETAKFLAWEDSYTVVVRTGVAADNKLVEHFTQMPKGLISTAGGEEVEGDIDVTWLAYSARRGANDTIGGVGIQGNNIFTKGYIKSQTAVEGGIKYFSLNWKQWATENNCTLKLRAELGNSEYSMEKAGTGPATYEHYFFAINAGIKSNVGIALYNESYNEDGPLASNGRITFDAFEIVPYLYYTEKAVSIMMSKESTTYQNTALIDNRDNEVAIVYSIVGDNDGVATIDATTGVVTCLKAGTITVQAAWAEVTTTYTLTIQQKIDDGIVRILGIGNSFTQDALEAYIMPIILGQGKKAIVGYPYLGGCWQSRHVQNYKNDTKAYNYYKIDEEGNMTSTGANGASLKQAIVNEPWDYVFIQSDHDSTGIVQSYIPHLNNLIEIVQTACSNKDVKIGMYMTWAYDSTSTRSAFAWYNNDSQTMYDSIINATQIMMDKVNVKEDMLIPAGTAIQNARTSYKGHTMNRDGYHLNYDYGRYIASLCYYSRIFGEDPKNVVYKPTTIDDYCADMCRAAAHAAMEKPFEVTDLVDYKEPTPPSPTKLNQTKGEELKVYKVVKDNQVMIIREGRTYNIMGVEE